MGNRMPGLEKNMREFIVENLTNTEALSVTVILMNNVIALIVAFFIMFTYKISYFSGQLRQALAAVYLSMRLLLLVLLFYFFFLLLQEKALHPVISCWLFRENLTAYIKQRQQWIPSFQERHMFP